MQTKTSISIKRLKGHTLVDLALGVDGLDTLLDGLVTVHAELQDGGTVNASSSDLGDNTYSVPDIKNDRK